MKKTLLLISALSLGLLASCGGGNGNGTQQSQADGESSEIVGVETDWTPPTDTIISKVWDAFRKKGNESFFGDDVPKIWTTTSMGVATEDVTKQIFCYQRDSIWLVIAERWGRQFYYYNENTGQMDYIPENEISESFPELNDRHCKLAFYRNCFVVAGSPMFEGAVTYSCTKNGLERSESEGYRKFLFLDDEMKCDASAFDVLTGPDFDKIPNGVRLKTSRFGLRHTTECVTDYVASTLGTPISDASGYQLHTKFPGPFYEWRDESKSNGKYVLIKTLFVNTDKKIMGIVRMTANDENSNISDMTFETIPYTLDNMPFSKDKCYVDFTKPVYARVYNDDYLDYVMDYRIYNDYNEIIEHYWVEDDVYDMPLINHYAFYYRHDGSIDTVNRSAVERTEYDFRNENYNEIYDGVAYNGSESRFQIPSRFDETKYDDQDRLIYSKYKATYSKDEWKIWEVRYKYVDDYCIKSVKTTERMDESEYCDECDTPSYRTFSQNYTIREYYLRVSGEPDITMRQNIETAFLREIFELLPNKNCEFNQLNSYEYSDNMYSAQSVGREGDSYMYRYNYWIKPLKDGRIWVMYYNYEEYDETVSDNNLYTYIYNGGRLAESNECLPHRENIANDFGIDESEVMDIDYSTNSYGELEVSFTANGEDFSAKYKWSGDGFVIVRE